jgi:hypothetical protein
MSIEKELRQNWDSVVYPEPDVDQQAMPPGYQEGDVLLAQARHPRTGRPMTGPTMSDVTEPAMGLLNMGASALKGVTQGFLGLPGELEALVYGAKELLTRRADEGAFDAFINGLKKETILPTTEEVKKWLDTNVGEVPGVKTFETLGETIAPGGQYKAVKAGAKALKNMPVGLTAKGAKLTPDVEVLSAGDITKPSFKKWFGTSQVVDDVGNPQVWYHGTAMDFEEFKPGTAGAMFFTDKPSFAEGLTARSGPNPAIAEQAAEMGWVNPNIIPVYLKAENPFDYENPEHRKMVIDFALQKYGSPRPDGKVALFEDNNPTLYDAEVLDAGMNVENKSNWTVIERKEIQDAIKSLGFDSFYVKENDVKNLGVYKPEQIKSVFNKGTWNPNDPRILHGAGVVGVGSGAGTMATSQQEPK